MKNPDSCSAFFLTRLEVVVAYLTVFKFSLVDADNAVEILPPPEKPTIIPKQPYVYGARDYIPALMACETPSEENEYRT